MYGLCKNGLYIANHAPNGQHWQAVEYVLGVFCLLFSLLLVHLVRHIWASLKEKKSGSCGTLFRLTCQIHLYNSSTM